MWQKAFRAGFLKGCSKLASSIESGVLRSWVVVLTLFFSKWLTPMDQKLVTLNGGLYRQIRGFGTRWFYGHWPTLDQILSFIIFLSRSYIDSDHFCINLCRRLRPGSIPTVTPAPVRKASSSPLHVSSSWQPTRVPSQTLARLLHVAVLSYYATWISRELFLR